MIPFKRSYIAYMLYYLIKALVYVELMIYIPLRMGR